MDTGMCDCVSVCEWVLRSLAIIVIIIYEPPDVVKIRRYCA